MRRCGKRFALSFLVFCLASLSLWAFPGRGAKAEEPVALEAPTAIAEEPTLEAESPKTPSGEASTTTSEEPNSSTESNVDAKPAEQTALAKAQRIADKAGLIVGSSKDELQLVLEELSDEIAVAEAASKAKDAEIEALRKDAGEAGTKAYAMLDGIIGFETGIPQFGVGATIGARFGNDIMAELGCDYMVGGINGYNSFDIDNFQFRASVGWMF